MSKIEREKGFGKCRRTRAKRSKMLANILEKAKLAKS